MHRTFSVPRLIGWWSLLLTLALHVGLQSAAAQPKGLSEVPVIVMAAGTTQTFQMSSKENLKRAENPNPKVVVLSKLSNDPTGILIEALAPGRVRITLTDVKDKSEAVDIVVLSDRVKDLRDLIQRSVPNSSVTVNANDSNTLVVLNGHVLTADDAKVIRAAARNLFGDNIVDNIRIGGVQTVQLEVVVAVVNRTRAKQLSFSWNLAGANWFASSVTGGPGGLTSILGPLTPSNTTASLTGTGTNLGFGILNQNSSFLGFLNLLTGEGVSKILAEPRVTTLSGRPAYIVSGGEAPILTSSGVGSPSVSYKNFGTVVSCLPTVLGNGKILLEVRPEISAIDPAASITIGGNTPTTVPGFKIRSAQVTVQIDDGQTLAIGGLIQNVFSNTVTKVPVLGDIPGLQALFTQKRMDESEEEMIILVTPRLVDGVDCSKIPKYLPGRETRSPDDFEFFLEGILEAPRSPRNVVFHPHLYQAAYKNAPNVGQIPCADGSCGPRGPAGCATGNCGPSAPHANLSTPHTSANVPVTNTAGAPNMVPAPTIPTVPAIPASNGNRILIEAEPAGLTPPVREIPPSLGPITPTVPMVPTIPPTPPRELQNRPVLPPISSSPYSPN